MEQEQYMPTYDYECTHCGHVFEAFQSITAEPISSCPKCGKAVRRLIGGGMGIIFKGSGFYSTDNKKGSADGANGKSKAKSSDEAKTVKSESSESSGKGSSDKTSSKVK
jgi:putative FmdB family regulatory protein